MHIYIYIYRYTHIIMIILEAGSKSTHQLCKTRACMCEALLSLSLLFAATSGDTPSNHSP